MKNFLKKIFLHAVGLLAEEAVPLDHVLVSRERLNDVVKNLYPGEQYKSWISLASILDAVPASHLKKPDALGIRSHIWEMDKILETPDDVVEVKKTLIKQLQNGRSALYIFADLFEGHGCKIRTPYFSAPNIQPLFKNGSSRQQMELGHEYACVLRAFAHEINLLTQELGLSIDQQRVSWNKQGESDRRHRFY